VPFERGPAFGVGEVRSLNPPSEGGFHPLLVAGILIDAHFPNGS
jgi:hypothetical protein